MHIKDVHGLKHAITRTLWHFFVHQRDRFTVTSRNYIWLHDLSITPDKSCIVPLISRENVLSFNRQGLDMYAVCTDYPIDAKEILEGSLV
jgi:hypothetical protein